MSVNQQLFVLPEISSPWQAALEENRNRPLFYFTGLFATWKLHPTWCGNNADILRYWKADVVFPQKGQKARFLWESLKKTDRFFCRVSSVLILNAHWTAGSVFVGNSALTDFGKGLQRKFLPDQTGTYCFDFYSYQPPTHSRLLDSLFRFRWRLRRFMPRFLLWPHFTAGRQVCTGHPFAASGSMGNFMLFYYQSKQ